MYRAAGRIGGIVAEIAIVQNRVGRDDRQGATVSPGMVAIKIAIAEGHGARV